MSARVLALYSQKTRLDRERKMLEREPVVSPAVRKHVKVNFVEHYAVLFFPWLSRALQ